MVSDLSICVQMLIRYSAKGKKSRDRSDYSGDSDEEFVYKNVKCHYLDTVRGCGKHLENKT